MTNIDDITDAANKTNVILTGVPASAGVAIGKVFILEDDDFISVKKEVPAGKIHEETQRFKDAIEKTRLELLENHAKLNDMLGENYAKIADAHLLILNDPVKQRILSL
jgi:phosphotransferase system enzyme I (PtsI)